MSDEHIYIYICFKKLLSHFLSPHYKHFDTAGAEDTGTPLFSTTTVSLSPPKPTLAPLHFRRESEKT